MFIYIYVTKKETKKKKKKKKRKHYLSFFYQFLKQAHPALNLDTSIVATRGSVKKSIKMVIYVDPDEMVQYEMSHLD